MVEISYVINQTRKSVFDHIFKHDSKSGQTPYMLRLFDIFSQSKLKLRSKWGNKIVQIYANQDFQTSHGHDLVSLRRKFLVTAVIKKN